MATSTTWKASSRRPAPRGPNNASSWIVAEGIEETVTLDAVLSAAGPAPAAAQLLAGSGYLLGRPAPRPRSHDVHDDLLAHLGGGTWLPDPVERGG